MDGFTVDAFVNRDEPIPAVVLDPADDVSADDSPSERERKRDRLKQHGRNIKENLRKVHGKTAETGSSMQDRLLEKVLQQIIPLEDPSSSKDDFKGTEPSDFISRPSFSLPTMSANFRRFNARIGVVFVFQAKVIRLLSWKTPAHTVSFLAIYSFICLDSYLLSVLPLALLLLALLIPAFIARHPAPPPTITSSNSNSSSSFQYNVSGPPIAPAPTVKPVKELSRDFFRNMRDLQNSMEDFSRVHDRIITLLTPPTNFSNEPLSSTLFLFTFFTATVLFIASHLLPWRLIFLAIGWIVTAMGHPSIQRQLLYTHKKHVEPLEEQSKTWLDSWIAQDIILDSAPETREVEIFELQYQPYGSDEWTSWLFSSSPYDPLSIERVRGERPRGTRFFEDVQPPKGWEWSEKKWALDLWSKEWVEERIITDVEVETEGERWVYDIRYKYENDYPGASLNGRDSMDDGLAYGGVGGFVVNAGVGLGTVGGLGKKKALPRWEEGSEAEAEGGGRRAEWRRRRWVRMVKRRLQNTENRPAADVRS